MDHELVRNLFATRPPDFIAARNALVKALKQAKDRDAATAVAALRRPGWADWALNVVAAAEPEAVEGFAAAARQMREAQAAAIEDRDGPDLRVALTELRERTAELTRLAAAALVDVDRPPDTPEITSRLAAIAGNAATIDELTAGVLGSGDSGAVDLFAGLSAPAARRAPAGRKGEPAQKPAAKGAATATEVDAAAVAAARRERQRALTRAEREHESSMRGLARADAELETAEAAVQKAAAELAQLTERRDAAAAKRQAAAEALDRTKAALDEARAATEGDS